MSDLRHPAHLRVAIDDVFAHWDDPLFDGDRVAFIPPVAGGVSMFRISSTAIDPLREAHALRDDRAGALVEFVGIVRDNHQGRAVSGLDYETYEPLASNEGECICGEAANRFDVLRIECVHRVGSLRIGETAVWIGILSAHRHPAFEACRYVIDELKKRVSIWKKEHYLEGGAEWVDPTK